MFRKNKFIKSESDIQKIREAGHILFLIHNEIKKNIKPGISLFSLDEIANKILKENNATSAFLNYNGFPKSICTSINEVLVHGIPNDYVLKEGDIISVDVGVKKNNFYADAAFTVGVGEINEKNELLINAANTCLEKAINFIKPKITTGDLGNFIETEVNKYGFNVPIQYIGHGIGKELHEDPMIPNYGEIGEGDILEEGMVICVEPMLIDGRDELFVDPLDNWTVRTKHGGNCAHVEHTILITKNGAEILTNK